MKVYFVDFWVGLKQDDNFLFNALKKKYEIEIDENNPDVLFFSCYGNNHLRFRNCVKIYYTGENDVPNFTWCDYAMGFDYIEFGDRYMRLPEYAIQERYHELYEPRKLNDDLFERKFCNFVYSNNLADPLRNFFFHKLSEYKHVDSGGVVENNIGGRVSNKLKFISDYKFTIAFENSAYPGYTTEKLIEPMACNSLPIYYGNPMVNKDFQTDSFVWVKDSRDVERAIEEIKYLDNNKSAYMEKLSCGKIIGDEFFDVDGMICSFLGHVFENPLSESRRRARYGFTQDYYDDFVSGVLNWNELRNPKSESAHKKSLIKKVVRKIKKTLNHE